MFVGQGWHAVRPLASLYRPLGQLLQLADPFTSPNFPNSQPKQIALVFSPLVQALHMSLLLQFFSTGTLQLWQLLIQFALAMVFGVYQSKIAQASQGTHGLLPSVLVALQQQIRIQ